MYKTLIKQKLNPNTLLYKPCAILMGRIGAGKTTLANKLCGTQHKSCAARGSVTKELFRNDVSCGNNAFSLIDTPGTDSSVETYKHAVLLKEGLTATKINTIFLIIKYDNRFEKMIDNYFEVQQTVHKYEKKIVVLISHMDASQTPEEDFKGICEAFGEDCPDVANIIFFSQESSEEEIADLMYSCVSLMKQDKLEISDEEFHLKFNIYEMKSQMKKSFNDYLKDVNSIFKEYTDLINTAKSESDEVRDEILHMIIVQFKVEIEKIFEDYKEKHVGAMVELEYYSFSIKMQKMNVYICDTFVGNVVPLMSYNLFDNKDPRNLIKRCPHCDLIWFKTEGCDGSTTCGNRDFDNYYDTGFGNAFKYMVTRISGKLRWEKNSVQKKELKKTPDQVKDKSNKVGCGKTIVWSELPKLEDALILELYKVKSIDEAINLIKSEDFNNARQDYERSINKEFQT